VKSGLGWACQVGLRASATTMHSRKAWRNSLIALHKSEMRHHLPDRVLLPVGVDLFQRLLNHLNRLLDDLGDVCARGTRAFRNLGEVANHILVHRADDPNGDAKVACNGWHDSQQERRALSIIVGINAE
jgi:hypothetical protein